MTLPTTRSTALITFVFLAACDSPFVPQDDAHGNKDYGLRAQEWLRWALAQPHSTASPIADETGEFCAGGQSGKFWNLAGTFEGAVERTCTVPAHKFLFFPLVNRWGVNPDHEFFATDEEFIAGATEYFAQSRASTCALTLRLDGEDLLGDDLEVLDEALYVEVLEIFEVDINPDNYGTEFGLGGPTPTLTDGHFALLRPLDAGEHVIEFGGSICEGDDVVYETAARYELTVEN